MRYMSYLKQLIRENVQTATVLFRNWYQGLLESGRGSQFLANSRLGFVGGEIKCIRTGCTGSRKRWSCILWIGLKIFDTATVLPETISIYKTDPSQNDDSTLTSKRPALIRWHSIIQFISPIPNPLQTTIDKPLAICFWSWWESWKWNIMKFVILFAVYFEYFSTSQYQGQWN